MDSKWQENLEFWQSPEGKFFYWFSTAYEIAKEIFILLIGFILEFPKTALGIFVGAIIGFLISIIPLIGWILEPVVKPVCIITGGIVGFLKDRER
jgi:hypothetical protein